MLELDHSLIESLYNKLIEQLFIFYHYILIKGISLSGFHAANIVEH